MHLRQWKVHGYVESIQRVNTVMEAVRISMRCTTVR